MDEYDFVKESADTYYLCWRANDNDGYHYNLFLEEIEAVGKSILEKCDEALQRVSASSFFSISIINDVWLGEDA